MTDVAEYYASPDVRARIVEYCGGSTRTGPTAAYVAALTTTPGWLPAWDEALKVPGHEIARLWPMGADLARALWDTGHLIFMIELDYLNADEPTAPFLHPADMFLKLEPVYRAALQVCRELRLRVSAVATGRGYHFVGRIPLRHPVVDALAALAPGTPAWLAGLEARRPTGVTATMSDQQARAVTGLGLLIEFTAHRILERSGRAEIPVVFNGTVVGRSGAGGRECVSIDFSHVGDPVDTRHVRTAFSTYQWHRLRPDIFGHRASSLIPPLAAVPRGRQSLVALLTHSRQLSRACRTATHVRTPLPNIASGVEQLLIAYHASRLRRAHERFHAELRTPAPPRALPLRDLPPCVSAALDRPNDLLLKPEYLQHLVRALMSLGWRPAQIVRVIQSRYEADHHWGNRWQAHMHPRTRAEFEVRVFSGLIDAGRDQLVDFNCVSAQEKGLCPGGACAHDLRTDRDAMARRAV
jgi:hypothetical protein